ncbi:hypothetical protein BRARA_E01149 [Brassica rapa]|uniref:F-box associated beta-propeller type 3 domain-containing protein n=1 Tax=Brassica campestris TaxID=3711 RepID=A0A397ZI58_BRACM|nr:hypothetical protein BRARA_E01149 [Brassica rapa]
MTWRLIECDVPHSSPGRVYVCINGVLYYFDRGASNVDDMIICFDLRSEKFSFVKSMERGMRFETLINFQGKLASVRSLESFVVSGTSRSFEMWILEDPEKHEWSKRIFNLPPLWTDAAPRKILYFVGVNDTNEFVFKPFCSSEPFYVHYYNFVNKAIKRVEIQGMGAFEKASGVRIFLNHVEDVKLMQ